MFLSLFFVRGYSRFNTPNQPIPQTNKFSYIVLSSLFKLNLWQKQQRNLLTLKLKMFNKGKELALLAEGGLTPRVRVSGVKPWQYCIKDPI
jgi:hypothetical protein